MRFSASCFLAICLLGFFTSCDQKPSEMDKIRPVRAMKAISAQDASIRAFPTRTRATDRTDLSFRVDGPLIMRDVVVGDTVKKGETIAKLDPELYQIRLRNMAANLKQSEAQLSFATNDYSRATRLADEDPGAISQSQLDEKKEERNRLRAMVQSNRAELRNAKKNLDYTELKAPYDGIITATYAQQYEYIREKQPVLRMLGTKSMEALVDIPEQLITSIPRANRIEVTLDSLSKREFEASIKEIGNEPSATTRTYPVTLNIEQGAESVVIPGMVGIAKFHFKPAQEQEKEYEVPISALMSPENPSETYAWIVNPDTNIVERILVEIGALTNRGILVKGDLENQWIVTAGIHYLKEGQKVKILEVVLDEDGQQKEVETSEIFKEE